MKNGAPGNLALTYLTPTSMEEVCDLPPPLAIGSGSLINLVLGGINSELLAAWVVVDVLLGVLWESM